MTHLYALTIILPNTDYDISLYPWFTEEEKFDLWSANNLSQYLRKANSIPGKGLPVAIAKPLLKDMLVTSQAASKPIYVLHTVKIQFLYSPC